MPLRPRMMRRGERRGDSRWRRRPEGATFLRTWAVVSLLFLAFAAVWSLAAPIPSGPDEPTQYVKSAAVAGGTLTGEQPPGFPPETVTVRVPRTFMLYDEKFGCYYLHPEVPAGCTTGPGADSTEEVTSTYVGKYPPLYYALTGIPTLLSTDPWTRAAMRGVGAMAGTAFLGLAFAAAVTWSRSRWLLAGLALTVTPTAFYLCAVLNPNGLEISAAICAWTAGILLVFEHSDRPPPLLVGTFTAATIVLALTRPLSPLWVIAILATLTVMRPGAARQLVRHAVVRKGLAATALGVLAAGLYVMANGSLAIEKFPLPPGLTDRQIAAIAVGQLPMHVRGLVGQFGAPEFTAPTLAVFVWVLGVGVLVCVALSLGRRGEAAVLAIITFGVLVVLPIVATYPRARAYGLTWQGRYGFPAAAGIPLLAAAVVGGTAARMGRARFLLAAGLVAGHLATWYWVLRRYTVGLGQYVNAFARVPGGWRPALSAWLLAAAAAVIMLAYGGWLLRRLARPLPLEVAPAGPRLVDLTAEATTPRADRMERILSE